SLTVPMGLTAGREGATPQLALHYDSGHGNGVFGLGWGLGVGSIARRTDKRLPRYVDDGPDADVYVLSGAQDLVAALVDDGAGGGRPDEYAVVDAGVTSLARRFRPRVEAAFARIERWRSPDDVIHWRVTDRGNHTTVYGRTAGGRVADPAD